MINLTEITNRSGFKKLVYKSWRWSIALAILGGVFMINEWPYSNIILSIAGIVLVLIYFVLAFGPLHEEVDWTLVFPELAGVSADEEFETESPLQKIKRLEKEIEELKKKL